MEARPLPQGTTSQQAELLALVQAFTFAKGKTVNIYTDSRYAYHIMHSNAQMWQAQGTPIINGKLIKALLDAAQLPTKAAIIHCKGHQKGKQSLSEANNKADLTANTATLKEEKKSKICPFNTRNCFTCFPLAPFVMLSLNCFL